MRLPSTLLTAIGRRIGNRLWSFAEMSVRRPFGFVVRYGHCCAMTNGRGANFNAFFATNIAWRIVPLLRL
jgi:hypothetical protein